MLKNTEKKKQEKSSFKIEPIPHPEQKVLLSTYEKYYKLNKAGRYTRLMVTINTTSCGSIQIGNCEPYGNSNLSTTDAKEFINHIIDEYDDRNHIYFLDRDGGNLETLFEPTKLFTKVWSHYNPNSGNTVNTWCYNIKTEDEFDDDDYWEDEEDDYYG